MNPAPEPLKGWSQFGEDIAVWEFFGRKADGVFLEAGANHPQTLSQTYFLETKGWSGVLVEPVPECCDLLRAGRPRSQVFPNALGAPAQRGKLTLRIPVGLSELTQAVDLSAESAPGDRLIEAELITLNDVLARAGVTKLDYLSLDLEGMEVAAMQGLDFQRYQPALVLVEDKIDNLSKYDYLCAQGYRFYRRTGCNYWYVPQTDSTHFASWRMRFMLARKFYLSRPWRAVKRLLGLPSGD
jgi:FkbM family methyltransferase